MTTRTTTAGTAIAAARQPLPVIESEPERLFRVGPVRERDTVVCGSMPTGVWLERASGRISLGALGVLADDVLGYAVLGERPAAHWSVSTEISLDLCRPVESGTRLSGRAHPVFADRRGAVTSGGIFDEQGRLVAVGRQQGRFVTALPVDAGPDGERPAGRAAGEPRTAASLLDLLDLTVRRPHGDAVLDVVVTHDLVNPLGNLHGGITLCVADLVGITAMESQVRVLKTTSIHVAYLRPVPLGTAVTFVASVVHSGRTLAVARVDARTTEGKLCAVGTVTASSPMVEQQSRA